jgi:hypothetical protein
MAGQNKILNIQPQFVPSAAGNLLNCNITSLAGPVGFTATEPYIVVTHVRVTNNDNTVTHTVKLFKGLTGGSAAGTEVFWAGGAQIPVAGWLDWNGRMRFDAADFLTGIADVASKVTIQIDAEIGFS